MKLKKSIYCGIALFSILINSNSYAKNTVAAYHCPTIKEADDIGVRTLINKKDVRWAVISDGYPRYNNDKPVEFMGVILERQNDDSYDMSVTCIYKTEKNKKYALQPVKSFNWYVDAVAEKPIGSNWNMNNPLRLSCNSSVSGCGFYFR